MSRPTPYESTLTMQSYVQMRDHTDLDFLDVFTPSTNLERELGWDMQIRNLKGVVFQYKRPKLSKDGSHRFYIRYSDQEYPRQLDQMKKWNEGFTPNSSYYVLPLVSEHGAIDKTLMRTAFIDATVIPNYASVIHVPEDYCSDGSRQSRDPLEVYCSVPSNTDNNWTEKINATAVYGWNELYKDITDCNIGFKIRSQGNSLKHNYYHPEERRLSLEDINLKNCTLKELLGLQKEQGAYITRFGSDDDGTFA